MVIEINIPVEINQILYKINKHGCYTSNWKPYIQEIKVIEISCKEIRGKVSWGFVGKTRDCYCSRYSFDSLGKTVFKTKEVAQFCLDNIK